jgi:glutamate N-acetyltransferase/amino-acid N-acetyltransferase
VIAPDQAGDQLLGSFRQALVEVATDLAQQVVRDGEGASKFIQIQVDGATGDESARLIAMSIANSPLVKTAIAGEDANWGRIAMAVGKAYQPIDITWLGIRVGGHEVARNGARVIDLDEAPIDAHLGGDEITIDVTVGGGDGRATVWTSDLTHGYISINADYRS